MDKIITVVTNDNDCIKLLEDAGSSMNIEIRYEIQSNGKITNELSINDIKESTAVLFATDGEVEDIEKIERFIDCEYYEVEKQFIYNDVVSVLKEILADLN
ncbi:MAG: PTS sugar transporter subunit IIBC [Romboutsia sp.]|nr:PTS sugar transporter subunit IIBC [Romboutsia sp.]